MHVGARLCASGAGLGGRLRMGVVPACSPARLCHHQPGFTHFGFTDVREEEKKDKVHGVFSSVATRYDLMNDAMSAGVHRLWKDIFMARLAPSPRTRLLDVAGGTGDIAFRFLTHVERAAAGAEGATSSVAPAAPSGGVAADLQAEAERLGVAPIQLDDDDDAETADQHAEPQVVVCDINESMLEEGRRRARALHLQHRLSWVCADAERLPFADASFDAFTIAFGIRNVTHIDRVLSEAYRVLRPGGRFLCLEFSRVHNPALRWLYDQYSFQVIPPLGMVLAGDWESYQYLVESIRRFPDQLQFESMIRAAGFGLVSHENLTFGVVAIHSGFKIPPLDGSARS